MKPHQKRERSWLLESRERLKRQIEELKAEHFTQFLIAQALMARPSIFESFDYEDIWSAASRLLPEYLKSDLRNQGTDFQMVDMFLDTIPVSTLKSLDS